MVGLQQSAFAALAARWNLQDNAASTTIVAATGTNASLTGAGNTSASSVTPGPGTTLTRAISLDGTDDYIYAFNGTSTATKNKSVVTICCWFKVSSADTTGNHRLVYITGNTGNERAVIGITTAGIIFINARAGDAESNQQKLTSSAYDDNNWHHVAAVINYASDTITIYVDGSNVSQSGTISFTATATSNTDSSAVNLGSAALANYFKGQLADCRVYDSDESANISTIRADAGGISVIDPMSSTVPGVSRSPITGTIPGL